MQLLTDKANMLKKPLKDTENDLVICSFMSKAFTIAIPDNSSTKGASITTIFCTFGGISLFSFWEKGDGSIEETEAGVT